jgi:hypothetical protein
MRTVGDSHGEDAGQTDAEVGGSSCPAAALCCGRKIRRRRSDSAAKALGEGALVAGCRGGARLGSGPGRRRRRWNPNLSLSAWRKEGSCGFSQLGSAKIHSFWAYTAVRRRRLKADFGWAEGGFRVGWPIKQFDRCGQFFPNRSVFSFRSSTKLSPV